MRARASLALLLAASLVASLREWPRAPAERLVDGYHLLEGDLHTHSLLAAALPTPLDLVLLARRRGLDFVAVTDHNSLTGGRWAARLARWFPGLVIVPGEELTTRRTHALAVGLTEPIDVTLPLAQQAALVHAQGGALIAAHPHRASFEPFLALARAGALDGAELLHPERFELYGKDAASDRDFESFLSAARSASPSPVAAVGDSDFHGMSSLGYCRTVVFAAERSARGIVDALKAGRALAVAPDGSVAGDPAWAARLRRAGLQLPAAQHAYLFRDAGARALAFVSLFALGLGVTRRRA